MERQGPQQHEREDACEDNETCHIRTTKPHALRRLWNSVSDTAFEAFLSFRLGKQTSKDLSCLYVEIPEAKDHHVQLAKCIRRFAYEDVPERPSAHTIRIIVISDTHERHTALGTLPPCDILIHAGDIFMTNRRMSAAGAVGKARHFDAWLCTQPAKHRVVIAGNHDHILESLGADGAQSLLPSANYLCNSGIELMGLCLWGTPISLGTSANSAFQSPAFRSAALAATAAALPARGVDILISHGPEPELGRAAAPRLAHVHGHAHALHGIRWAREGRDGPPAAAGARWASVCGSVMDTRYVPRQPAIVLDVPPPPPAA